MEIRRSRNSAEIGDLAWFGWFLLPGTGRIGWDWRTFCVRDLFGARFHWYRRADKSFSSSSWTLHMLYVQYDSTRFKLHSGI